MRVTHRAKRRPQPHRRGATAVEYVLILALIVIPFALIAGPMFLGMISQYNYRIGWVIRLPFG